MIDNWHSAATAANKAGEAQREGHGGALGALTVVAAAARRRARKATETAVRLGIAADSARPEARRGVVAAVIAAAHFEGRVGRIADDRRGADSDALIDGGGRRRRLGLGVLNGES